MCVCVRVVDELDLQGQQTGNLRLCGRDADLRAGTSAWAILVRVHIFAFSLLPDLSLSPYLSRAEVLACWLSLCFGFWMVRAPISLSFRGAGQTSGHVPLADGGGEEVERASEMWVMRPTRQQGVSAWGVSKHMGLPHCECESGPSL